MNLFLLPYHHFFLMYSLNLHEWHLSILLLAQGRLNTGTPRSSGTATSGFHLFTTSTTPSDFHYFVLFCPGCSAVLHCQQLSQYSLKQCGKNIFKQQDKNREEEPDSSCLFLRSAGDSVLLVQFLTDQMLALYHQHEQFKWISTARFIMASIGL